MRIVLVFNLSEAFSEIKFLKESTIEQFIGDDYKFIIKVLELSLIFVCIFEFSPYNNWKVAPYFQML